MVYSGSGVFLLSRRVRLFFAPKPYTRNSYNSDDYCESYRDLFSEVRSFEAFKHLHAGMIPEAKRKSLPAIAKVVGLPNAQSLQQSLVNSPWSMSQLRKRRLELILLQLESRKLVLVIDETGDRKKRPYDRLCKATIYRQPGKSRERHRFCGCLWCSRQHHFPSEF
ncbi:MAG: hypothetical protein HC771_19420 [Synechococcales cyanobacterium CRU_2_2]|nr:hypothetical protein [Synechococcales cyanobacterium CRU_2_2]